MSDNAISSETERGTELYELLGPASWLRFAEVNQVDNQLTTKLLAILAAHTATGVKTTEIWQSFKIQELGYCGAVPSFIVFCLGLIFAMIALRATDTVTVPNPWWIWKQQRLLGLSIAEVRLTLQKSLEIATLANENRLSTRASHFNYSLACLSVQVFLLAFGHCMAVYFA